MLHARCLPCAREPGLPQVSHTTLLALCVLCLLCVCTACSKKLHAADSARPFSAPRFQCAWQLAGARDLMAAADMPVVGAPSAGGDLGSSPAPGPGLGAPQADVLFMLTAAGANLSAEKLVLTGVSDTALYSSSSRQTGVYTTGRPLSSMSCLYPQHMGYLLDTSWLEKPVCLISWPACSAGLHALLLLRLGAWCSCGDIWVG